MIQFGDTRLPPRFWSKVDVQPYGCWLWTAALDRGYGNFHFRGRLGRAHQAAYLALVGDIPKPLVCDHLCRVKNCVNPAHLDIVTIRENVLRGKTLPGANLKKTHCSKGHEFTPENTYLWPCRGRMARACRTCGKSTRARTNTRRRLQRQALRAVAC